MRRVGEALTERGFKVELITADAVIEAPAANLFVMCERGTVLDRLAAMEKAGAIVVNAPAAIRNTYRHRMVELFARHRVAAPVSWVVATDANKPRPADCAWVKRYDFHATQTDDVMYAASEAGWREALSRFAERGIPFVIAQEHVPGDLVKFYGVRNSARVKRRQLVPMVLSSRQRNAGSFVRRGSPEQGRHSTPPRRSGSRSSAATRSSRPTASR